MMPDQFRQHLKNKLKESMEEAAATLAENHSLDHGMMRWYQGRYSALKELMDMIDESYRTVG